MALSFFALAVHLGTALHASSAPAKQPEPHKGTTLILMYHHIGPEEKYMFRSEENFRRDLDRLYKNNYRPVTMDEYHTGALKLAPGQSPVVFTFDDSHRDQFNILDDGSVDPRCFVGVWSEFTKTHPDFPVKATFYINNNGPFGQEKWVQKKAETLKAWGSELGNHTMHHPNLKKLSDEQVKKEIAGTYDLIEKLGFKCNSFCYPFGIMPYDMSLIAKGFTLNGKTYKHTNATLAGDGPAWHPSDRSYNPHKVARIQAYPGDHGIDWWLDRVEAKKSTPYVQP